MFFHLIKIFPFKLFFELINSDRCTMEKISEIHNKYFIEKVTSNTDLIVKTVQNELRTRVKIPLSMIEKHKNDILH